MLLALTLLIACDADTTEADTAGADTTETGTTEGTAPSSTDTGEAPQDSEGTIAVSGSVLAPDGSPAADIRVTLCHGVCRYSDTDETGAFSFTGASPNTYALHFMELGTERGWAQVLVAIELVEGEDQVLETPLVMAPLGEDTLVEAATTVAVGEGLSLTLDPDEVVLPYGTDTLTVSAASPTTLPPGLPDAEILAIWYLDPFYATVEPGFSVQIANAWGVAPGEELQLYAASYLDYAWVDAGVVVASETGEVLSGGDVPAFSTLVLAK